jgi:hypothetical protein
MGRYDDHQYRLLWGVGFLLWCKSFAISNEGITALALAMGTTTDMESTAELTGTQDKYKRIMLAQLSKPTITAI